MPTHARARHLDGQHPRLQAIPIAHFTELADFLNRGYEAVDRVDGVTILKPKDSSIVCSFPG